jgi:hypothetical protein
MAAKNERIARALAGALEDSAVFEPLREALLEADEPKRYRLIAALLVELADHHPGGEDGQSVRPADRTEALTRIQALNEENALLKDELKIARADLKRHQERLETESTQAAEVHEVAKQRGGRLEALQKELSTLETRLTAKDEDLHKTQVENENLLLKVQRFEQQAGDRSAVEALEQGKKRLATEVERLERALEHLRHEKNAEIEKLRETAGQAKSAASGAGEDLLAGLWARLAKVNPPLAPPGVQPNLQTAERLVDAFIEWTRFGHEFSQSIRIFLNRYTKDTPALKRPWEAYVKGPDLWEVAASTVAPDSGRPVGFLKNRLRMLHMWTVAAMTACDSTIYSIESELQSHLLGPDGAGSDPKFTIKRYIQEDGCDKYLEHMLKHQAQKLLETFGKV